MYIRYTIFELKRHIGMWMEQSSICIFLAKFFSVALENIGKTHNSRFGFYVYSRNNSNLWKKNETFKNNKKPKEIWTQNYISRKTTKMQIRLCFIHMMIFNWRFLFIYFFLFLHSRYYIPERISTKFLC